MNQKNKTVLMVALLILFLGFLDVIAVQMGFSQMLMLAWTQVLGALAVAAYLLIKEYA